MNCIFSIANNGERTNSFFLAKTLCFVSTEIDYSLEKTMQQQAHEEPFKCDL